MFKGLMDRSTELCETWVPYSLSLTCPENEIDGIKPIHNVLYVYVIYDIFVIFSLKVFGVFGGG